MLIILTIFNSLLMVTGQILFKTGIMDKQLNSFYSVIQAFLNPFIMIGLGVYVCATGLWIYILNKAELSYVYPIQSTAFIFSLVAGVVLFKEHLTPTKVVGVIVIILGVFILTRK